MTFSECGFIVVNLEMCLKKESVFFSCLLFRFLVCFYSLFLFQTRDEETNIKRMREMDVDMVSQGMQFLFSHEPKAQRVDFQIEIRRCVWFVNHTMRHTEDVMSACWAVVFLPSSLLYGWRFQMKTSGEKKKTGHNKLIRMVLYLK